MSRTRYRWAARTGVSLLVVLLVATLLSPTALLARPVVDPDRPDFDNGSEQDGGDYLFAREADIALRRGLPYDRPARRLDAIRQLERTKRAPRSVSAASGAAAVAPTAAASGAAAAAPTAAWTALGPAPIPNGQTQVVSVPVSGRVTAVAVHPTDPNRVYVGTAQGGVYRSLDGGDSWTAIFDGAQSLAIGALAIAPSNPNIVFVGTGEPNLSLDSFFGVGVYRIDNAETTANLTGPINPPVATGVPGTTAFTGRAISKILVHPTDPATIFVATGSGYAGTSGTLLAGTVPPLALRGLYRSTNATSASPSFDKLTVTSAGSLGRDTSGNRPITDMVFGFGDPNVIVAGVYGNPVAGDGGVYRTTNALAPTPAFTQTMVISEANVRVQLATNKVSSTIMAATGEGSNGRLRKSIDSGLSWSGFLTGGTGYCGGQCFYDIALDVDPNNANTVYLGGQSGSNIFLRSFDGGNTFESSVTALHADVHAIAVAPSNPSIIYHGNDGGIWRSVDGGSSWTSLNRPGFFATQFQSVATHPLDRQFAIGGTQDNGTPFLRPDASWFRADYGDGGFAQIDQNAVDTVDVTMYHTYFNQTSNLIGFARVTNTASASDSYWQFLGCGGTFNGISCSDSTLFYAPMVLGPGTPNTLYFGTDRLYRSTDKGTSMAVVSQAPLFTGQPISAIGISAQDDSVRIVGLRNGKVFATTSGSSVLNDITCGCFPSNPSGGPAFVGRTVIDPKQSNTAYVTFDFYGPAGQGVWKTTNLNAATPTWVAASSGIPGVPINAFVVDPLNSNNLYAGTDIGVYRSADGGSSWTQFSDGLPVVAVFDLAFQAGGQAIGTNQILRAATHGRGIFETAIPLPLSADLSVTNTASPNPVTAGAPLTYSIGVANAGPYTATSPVLTDVLPTNTTFQSLAADPAWTCSTPPVGGTGTVRCTAPSLAVGVSPSFALTVNVSPSAPDGSTISDTASVSSSTPDPTPGDDTATYTAMVVAFADLAARNVGSPDPVNAGSVLTFSITVTNAGPSDAQSAVLSDDVPTGTTFSSFTQTSGGTWNCVTPPPGGTSTVTCSRASFAAGASATFALAVNVPPDAPQGSTVTDTATVSSAISDPDPTNNSASYTATVNNPGVRPATLSPSATPLRR